MLDALAKFDPMEWLTIGLLIFAGVQVYVSHAAEAARRRERLADEQARTDDRNRLADQDFQFAWAEHFRLDAFAKEIEKLDLVEQSLLGMLDHTQILPREWSELMAALSRIGVEAGYLGAVALTQAHDTARDIARLNNILGALKLARPERTVAELEQYARASVPGLNEYEVSVKQGVRETALLLWDAVAHSPRARVHRRMEFNDDLSSDLGRQATAALKARESSARPPGSVDRPRAG